MRGIVIARSPYVDGVSAMMVQLNLETRAYHAIADESWRRLMTPTVTKPAYIEQLMRVYGFEGPVEAALAYTPNLELVIDVHPRYRAGFIAQDLIGLGMRASEVARLPQAVVAPFASPLEALGWMYVVERANPLHDEVRRYLNVRLPDARDACVYLSAAEGLISARAQAFGHVLDRAARTSRARDELVTGAHAAFRTWLDWSERDVLRRLG